MNFGDEASTMTERGVDQGRTLVVNRPPQIMERVQ